MLRRSLWKTQGKTQVLRRNRWKTYGKHRCCVGTYRKRKENTGVAWEPMENERKHVCVCVAWELIENERKTLVFNETNENTMETVVLRWDL